MNKYVIKNCPNLYELLDGLVCTVTDDEDYCADCTDCLLKQVVDKCKKAIKTYDNEEFYEDDADIFMGESNMASTILDIFEIQEVE